LNSSIGVNTVGGVKYGGDAKLQQSGYKLVELHVAVWEWQFNRQKAFEVVTCMVETSHRRVAEIGVRKIKFRLERGIITGAEDSVVQAFFRVRLYETVTQHRWHVRANGERA